MNSDLYDVMSRRRDVRAQFDGGPVRDEVLLRILAAAHCAPSVGLTQPWDFVLVRDAQTRREFHSHVQQQRSVFDESLSTERAADFRRIRIDGILDATLGVVVTYDPDRGAPAALGKHAIADTGLYSVCLAIQNLWLAATAEDLGVGWVSFYREEYLQELLGIPPRIRPVAWLCVGPVTHLEATPDLERLGWQARRPLADFVHDERFSARSSLARG